MIAFAAHEELGFLPMLSNLTKMHLDKSERLLMFRVIRERLGEPIFAHTLLRVKGLYDHDEIDYEQVMHNMKKVS